MGPRILILTEADDVHAIAAAEAITLKGAEATLWATSDFPTRTEETLRFDRGCLRSLAIEGPQFSLRSPTFDVVWRRRPSYVIDRDQLHPADRAFAEAECGMFQRSILQILAPQAFWVNPPSGAARASSKILQHQAAVAVGLQMPETLYTNSAREVRAFAASKAGRVIYKPFSPTGWSDGDHRYMPYTAILEDNTVPDEALRQTPGIFQELVPKAYEIRLTMLGNRAFAAKVNSQETETGKLDWRQAPKELRLEPMQVPVELEERCAALLRELGLVFGCFDFIVTPAGETFFLEVNEMGQFLFVERYCGIPLLDAFASFLVQGTVDFEWSEANVNVRYSDVEFDARVLALLKQFSSEHVSVPARLIDERAGQASQAPVKN